MTISLLGKYDSAPIRFLDGLQSNAVANVKSLNRGGGGRRLSRCELLQLPPRPDASVLDASIPLFVIGQNRNGLWVVRAHQEQCGGVFLRKQAAVRFARGCAGQSGAAVMFVTEPLEVDVDHLRNGLLVPIVAAADAAARAAARVSRFIAGALAGWCRFTRQAFNL
jgi:hypothetical protein